MSASCMQHLLHRATKPLCMVGGVLPALRRCSHLRQTSPTIKFHHLVSIVTLPPNGARQHRITVLNSCNVSVVCCSDMYYADRIIVPTCLPLAAHEASTSPRLWRSVTLLRIHRTVYSVHYITRAYQTLFNRQRRPWYRARWRDLHLAASHQKYGCGS